MSKSVKTNSPLGEFEWVTISGEGKENLNGVFQYVVNLILEGDAAEAYKAKIDAFYEDHKPSGKKAAEPKSTGYYPHKVATGEVDEDGDKIYEETGKTLFAFKTNVEFADGKQKKVQVYNAKAQKVELGEKQIGNGTIGAVSGAMGMYEVKAKNGAKTGEAGVTLFLNAVQIKKLVEFTMDAGFEATDDDDGGWTGADEESGFESVDSEEATTTAKPRL